MNDFYYPETMVIRIPSFISRVLTAEVAKRNFYKKNGEANINGFINKMLPNMLAFRAYKKGFLRDYLDKKIKHSISAGKQEQILDFLAESFDYLYFDKSEFVSDDTLNIRFDISNADLFAKLFVRLDRMGIKRSSYIKNLILEYLNMAEYSKEGICFDQEFDGLNHAIAHELLLQFHFQDETVIAIPLALEYSATQEHWYFIYLEHGDFNTLHSLPLYEIKDVLALDPFDYSSENIYSEEIFAIIERGEFDKGYSFPLKGDNNG